MGRTRVTFFLSSFSSYLALSLIAVVVLAVQPAAAQFGRSVMGTVRVAEGRAPSNRVRVRLYGPSGAMVGEQYTDTSGNFSFPVGTPGEYIVEASLQGYATVRQNAVVMPVAGHRAIVQITLPVEASSGPPVPSGTVDVSIPAKAREHWEKAQAELRSSRPEKARKELEQAVKAYDAFAPAHRALAMLALDEGRLDAAAKSLKRAMELQPENPEGLALQGTLLNREKKYEEAKPLLEKALRGDPNSWRAHFELAQALFAGKDYAQALPHARKALALKGDSFAEGHVLLANLLMNLKQYPEAAQHLSAFVKLAPNSPSAAPAREVLKKMKQAGVPGAE